MTKSVDQLPGPMIRQIRKDRGLLQKTVAYQAHIDPSRLARFERASGRPPSPEVVERILDVLKTDDTQRVLILSQVVVDRISWKAFERYDADRLPPARALLRSGMRLNAIQLRLVLALIENTVPVAPEAT